MENDNTKAQWRWECPAPEDFFKPGEAPKPGEAIQVEAYEEYWVIPEHD